MNGFIWWVGVVEDRKDPLKLGRCKIRIFGWHTENLQLLPTDALPWAMPMLPLNNANTYTPKESDMVVGFFIDGENGQQPVMMGVLPGIPLNPANPKTGFNDTRTKTQLDISPVKPGEGKNHYPRKVDEPTTSRLARNESDYVPQQIQFLKSKKADKVEKNASYNPRYPYNNVLESESGHAIEIDDTPDYERLNFYHRSGSNLEFRPDGSVQEKVMKEKTTVIESNDIQYIKGNQVVYVDGNITYIVKGKVTYSVDKDFTVSAQNISLNAKSNFRASAQISASVSGKVSSSLGGLICAKTSVSGIMTTVSAIAKLDATSPASTFSGKGVCTVSGGLINLSSSAVGASETSETPADDSVGSEEFGLYSPDGIDSMGQPIEGAITAVDSSTIASSITDSAAVTSVVESNVIENSVSALSDQLDSVVNVIDDTVDPSLWNLADGASFATESSYLDNLAELGTQALDNIEQSVSGIGNDVLQSIGYNDLVEKGERFTALSRVASATGSAKDAAAAVSAGLELTAAAASTASALTEINVAALSIRNFASDACSAIKDSEIAKTISDSLSENKNEITDAIRKIRDDVRDGIKDLTSDVRQSLKDLEDKSLQEWLNSNHYDTSANICAEEARELLKSGRSTDDVRSALTACMIREGNAAIERGKSTFPSANKDLKTKQKNFCA